MTEQPSDRSTDELPPHPAPMNHGNTRAAWTLVVLVLVGAVVAALGVAFATVWLFVVGAAVIVAGIVAGWVLQRLGHGQTQPGDPREP